MISQAEIERIKNIKGLARGQTVINTFRGILSIEGKEGLKKLEMRLKELNLWVKEYEDFPKNINPFNWYPLWYDILLMVIAADFFNWDREKVRELGVYIRKLSFFEKLFLKYLSKKITARNLPIISRNISKYWKKHYSIGELKVVEIRDEEKKARMVLEDFLAHPVFCYMLEGYSQSLVTTLVNSPTKCQEEKCPFKGDPYHEFWLSW